MSPKIFFTLIIITSLYSCTNTPQKLSNNSRKIASVIERFSCWDSNGRNRNTLQVNPTSDDMIIKISASTKDKKQYAGEVNLRRDASLEGDTLMIWGDLPQIGTTLRGNVLKFGVQLNRNDLQKDHFKAKAMFNPDSYDNVPLSDIDCRPGAMPFPNV